MKVRIFRLLATSLALAYGLSAATIIIDHFDETQAVSVSGGAGNPVTAESNSAAAGAIGGFRDIKLTRTLGAGTANASSNTIASVFRISTDDDADADVFMFWDGGNDTTFSPTGLGGVDLTSGGLNDRIKVGLRSDLVVTLTLTVYTNGTNYLTRSFSSPGGGTGLPFTTLDLLFSSFTATGSPSFGSVGGITLAFAGPQSFDMQMEILDSDSGVPEPATLTLIGAGLLALGIARKKRLV